MAGTGTRKQNILVFVAAILTIAASVLVTLQMNGMLIGGFAEDQGYQNVTFTDAAVKCREKTRAEFGELLHSSAMDNHSSRYDEKEFLYKVFIKADVYAKKDKGITLNYINCFVRASNGRISKYEIFEDKEKPNSPLRKGNVNAFGWPK